MKLTTYILTCVIAFLVVSCTTPKDNDPAMALNDYLNKLASAEQINIWNPDDRELYSVTNHQVIAELANWVRSQPLEYDEEHSLSIQQGAVCCCLPVGIVISTNEFISIHMHNLIINDHAFFSQSESNSFDLDRVLIIAKLRKEPVQISLTHDQALVLVDYIDRRFFAKNSGEQNEATAVVMEEIMSQT